MPTPPTTVAPSSSPTTAVPSTSPTTGLPTTRAPTRPTASPTTLAPNAGVACGAQDSIQTTITFTPCNAAMNATFSNAIPGIIKTLLGGGSDLQVTVTQPATASTCKYGVVVKNTSGKSWLCRADLAALSDTASIQAALNASCVNGFAATTFQVSAASVTVATPAPTSSPIPFSPYVIIIPAVIVVILFAVCLWMWCARPKIKRQERPVFDGFEMGDAQQLESSSNLEFAVPEVEFDDKGGSKHRLTIN